jgi:hypothetical protein
MLVKAQPGAFCPKELSRIRITDEQPQEVPNSAYYRRLIHEGSLVVVEPEPAAPETELPNAKAANKKTKGGNS